MTKKKRITVCFTKCNVFYYFILFQRVVSTYCCQLLTIKFFGKILNNDCLHCTCGQSRHYMEPNYDILFSKLYFIGYLSMNYFIFSFLHYILELEIEFTICVGSMPSIISRYMRESARPN